MFNRIRIILSHPSHPGNIGSTARAMKTMGLYNLVLINPKEFPSNIATAMAAGALDVLEQAKVVDSLEMSLIGCHFIVALSARERSLAWPLVSPRIGVKKIESILDRTTGDVAILFGTESTGLTNQELNVANLHIHIPSNPEYSSLNLSQAVQVLSYEIRLMILNKQGHIDSKQDKREAPLASREKLLGFYQHLEKFLQDIQFLNPNQPRRLMARLKRLYARAEPDEQDINILRGMLTTIDRRLLAKTGHRTMSLRRYRRRFGSRL